MRVGVNLMIKGSKRRAGGSEAQDGGIRHENIGKKTCQRLMAILASFGERERNATLCF